MKEFDEGIYKLQKLDYDVGFEWPKPLRVKNTLYARIKFPDSLEVERGSRHDKLSAKIKLEEKSSNSVAEKRNLENAKRKALATVKPPTLTNNWDNAVFQMYSKIDDRLGLKRETPNPLADLFQTALDRLRDDTVSHPKFKDWEHYIDFILDLKVDTNKSRNKSTTLQDLMGLGVLEDHTKTRKAFSDYCHMRDTDKIYEPAIFNPLEDAKFPPVTDVQWIPSDPENHPDILDEPIELYDNEEAYNLAERHDNLQNYYHTNFRKDFQELTPRYVEQQTQMKLIGDDQNYIPDVYQVIKFKDPSLTGKDLVKDQKKGAFLYYFAFNGQKTEIAKLQARLESDEAYFLGSVASRYALDANNPYTPLAIRMKRAIEIEQDPNSVGASLQPTVPTRDSIIRDSDAPRMSECLEGYIVSKSLEDVSDSTRAITRQTISNAILILGDLNIDQITPAHWDQLLTAYETDGWTLPNCTKKALSVNSVKTYGNKVKRYVTYLQKIQHPVTSRSYVPSHPFLASSYKNYGYDKNLDIRYEGWQPWDEQQIYKLCDFKSSTIGTHFGGTAQNVEQEILLIKTMLASGMREQEIASLVWKQVIYPKRGNNSGIRYIDLTRNPIKNETHEYLARVKTENARRRVCLPEWLWKLWPNRDEDETKKVFSQFSFNAKNKAEISTRHLQRWLYPLRRFGFKDSDSGLDIGILEKKKVFHSLRSNWASKMEGLQSSKLGVTNQEIDYMGGWEVPKGSRKSYSRTNPLDLERQSEIINAVKYPSLKQGIRTQYLLEYPFDPTKPFDEEKSQEVLSGLL